MLSSLSTASANHLSPASYQPPNAGSSSRTNWAARQYDRLLQDQFFLYDRRS